MSGQTSLIPSTSPPDTSTIVDKDAVSPFDNATVFPLYLYPQSDNLLDVAEEGRRPNLTPQFTEDLSEALGLRFVLDGQGDLEETFGPEDVFHYAYAVFTGTIRRSV